ncbi:MAG: SpaA isopeptide-forming pilin-related protein [Lachnospiraceae bacterium]|nr:SpaA isopeptide-forming pilin-related protein [Lachnospiraceae bacterium]MDD3615315.1 SpaA isopeptide-forming pilin-related protein [Lachnospiraceae bacterium]
MKSKIKKRLLAILLCMVLVLGYTIQAVADDVASSSESVEAATAAAGQSMNAAAESEAIADVDSPESAGPQQSEPQQSAESQSAPSQAEPQPEPQQSEPQQSEPQQSEPQQPESQQGIAQSQQSEEIPAEDSGENGNSATTVVQPAMELRHQFVDANGNVVSTITANIPEGTFQADTLAVSSENTAPQVTMEVSEADAGMDAALRTLMSESLPQDSILGNYFLYNIQFKVNGQPAEPGKEILITIERDNFLIEDTKKAHVFYYNPANSIAGNIEPQIMEIMQESELIDILQGAGQSLENLSDYDSSWISLNAEKTAGWIQLEGRRSTLYGCYVEQEKPAAEPEVPELEVPEPEETQKPAALTYENEDVRISAAADKESDIPEGASLQVVPILSQEADTAEKYQAVKEQLDKKADGEEYAIAGFLAYDISILDAQGVEIEPEGNIKVTIEYKKETIPEQVDSSADGDTDIDVTVMHLEENSIGEVENVADLSAGNDKAAVVTTTDTGKVQKAEFVTGSFSTFTITWLVNSWTAAKVNVHYVDTEGNEILDVAADNVNGSTTDRSVISLGSYQKEIYNYTFVKAAIGSYQGTAVTQLRYRSSNNNYRIQYDNGNSWTTWLTLTDWGNPPTGELYLVYKNESGSGGGGGGEGTLPELGTPDHQKTIRKNEEDYTLSLDVTGVVGEATPIDILLIIDKSYSMNTGSRISNVNSAIQTLLQTLKSADTQKVSINLAAVTFSSDSRLQSQNSTNASQSTGGDAWLGKDWTSLDSISLTSNSNNFFTLGTGSGGTNWQAGIYKGAQNLSARPVNTRKYVLFLTDGDPTFRIGSITNTNTLAGTTLGNGNSDPAESGFPNGKNYAAAVTEWKNSAILSANSTNKYVIDANPSSDNKCDKFAAAVGATELQGNNAESMKTSFQTIANGILRPAYSAVTIKDTLSTYTGFAFDKNTETTVGGRTYHPQISVYSSKNGAETQLSEYMDYTITTMDYENKVVGVSIRNGKELEDGVTYSVRFNIIPSEAAAVEYMQNGAYNAVGDANTDAPGNDTSSAKEGFYSNDNANAVVAYKENGVEKDPAHYDKPVIQIDSISRLARKQWVGTPASEVTLNLLAKTTIGEELMTLTYLNPANAEITAQGEWKYTWENLPKYHYYIDEETHLDKRAEIQYYVGEETLEGYEAQIPEEQSNTETTVITNTKNERWKILKVSSSLNDQGEHPLLAGAVFTLTDSTTNVVYSGISDSDGVINWTTASGESIATEDMEAGNYILKESSAPAGYAKSILEWEITLANKGAVPDITDRNHTPIAYETEIDEDGMKTHVYSYEDTPIYSLPSAGGMGIYWCTIAGVILMLASAIILLHIKGVLNLKL